MKKRINLYLICALFLIIFFVAGCGKSNQNQGNDSNQSDNQNNLNQNAFLSCQASQQKNSLGNDVTYIIKVIGVENQTCHWQYVIQSSQFNQTNDCFYPLDKMSDNAFQHLFGQDKTGTGCSGDTCKEQESLIQTYCKLI